MNHSRELIFETHDKRNKSATRSMAARYAFNRHWRLYIFEGSELAIFDDLACFATASYPLYLSFPALHLIPFAAIRRLLMGIAMGSTAVLIIHSPRDGRQLEVPVNDKQNSRCNDN